MDSQGKRQPAIGPALALIDAVLHENLGQVYSIADIVGVEETACSVAELSHRMLEQAEMLGDAEELIDLKLVAQRKWPYYEFAIRWIDQKVWWTPAQIYARSYAGMLLTHYIIGASVNPGGRGIGRPTLNFDQARMRYPRQMTLGIAYFATLLAVELADYEEVDLSERIDGYRAYAAEESLTATA